MEQPPVEESFHWFRLRVSFITPIRHYFTMAFAICYDQEYAQKALCEHRAFMHRISTEYSKVCRHETDRVLSLMWTYGLYALNESIINFLV